MRMKKRFILPSGKTYRGKFFYFLIGTYIVMLILPILFSFIALKQTSANINTSLESYNQTLLKRYGESLNTQLDQVALLAYELSDDPLIQTLVNTRNLQPQTRLEIYRLIEQMPSRLLVSYPQVTDYYIYFNSCDLIMTSTGTFTTDLFYRANFQDNSDVSYESWLEHISTPTIFGTYHAAAGQALSCKMAEKNIAYVKSVAFDEANNRQATIVILVSKEYLRSRCMSSDMLSDGEINLYDNNGRLLITTNASGQSSIQYNAESGVFEAPDGSGMLTCYHLDKLNATLIYTLREGDFTARLWASYTQLRTVMFLMAVISVLLAILFAFIFYRPLGDLVSYLREKQDIPVSRDEDGYQYIRNSIDRLMASHEERKLELQISKRLIAENQLERLLEADECEPVTNVRQVLTQYEIHLPHDFAMVIVFHCQTRVFHHEKTWQSFMRCVFQTMGEDCVMRCLHRDEPDSSIILNLPAPIDETQRSLLAQAMTQWTVQEQLSGVTLALGAVCPIGQLHQSYQTANEAMEYAFLYPAKVVLDSRVAQGRSAKYYYPPEVENKLIGAVMQRDWNTVKPLLDMLFIQNTQRRTLTVQGTRLFLYALLNTVYQLEVVLKTDTTPVFGASPAVLITSSLNILEAQTQIDFIFSTLCHAGETEKGTQEPSWRVNQVVEYIRAHYLDAALSLDAVAEHFHITPQYLSALFKKNVHENFSAYVQRLRLEHAKKLMADPQLTLSAIAQRSGFNNYLALARVFQKFDNLSPGAYRERYFAAQHPSDS